MAAALPALIIGSIVGGGALAAVGSAKSGQAAYQQANYQAAVNENNAKYADYQAAETLAKGKVDEANQERQTAQLAGTQRATLAGLGQLLDTGSAGTITADTSQMGEVDAATIRRNSARQALSFNLQADDFRSGANLNRMSGDSALSAGYLGAASTILGSAGKAASFEYGYQQSKVPTFKGP